MSADRPAAALESLVGQHPAALRGVHWIGPEPGQASHPYLEIETKHGRVVVIDPDTGAACCRPPLPSEIPADAVRVAEDLTEQVPAAFDGRPVITAVSVPAGRRGVVRLQLSTGSELTLTTGSAVPQSSARDAPPPAPGASP